MISLMIIVISSMMDVISFMLDGCIMYGLLVSFILLYLYYGFNVDDVSPFHICILWTLDFILFLYVDVVDVRLSLIKLNVTQRLKILKECNWLYIVVDDYVLLLPLLRCDVIGLSFMFKIKKKV